MNGDDEDSQSMENGDGKEFSEVSSSGCSESESASESDSDSDSRKVAAKKAKAAEDEEEPVEVIGVPVLDAFGMNVCYDAFGMYDHGLYLEFLRKSRARGACEIAARSRVSHWRQFARNGPGGCMIGAAYRGYKHFPTCVCFQGKVVMIKREDNDDGPPISVISPEGYDREKFYARLAVVPDSTCALRCVHVCEKPKGHGLLSNAHAACVKREPSCVKMRV